jgi:hypothetical protein
LPVFLDSRDHSTGRWPRLGGYAPPRRGAAVEFLITIKADVVDAHFAGLDTIHDLLKVLVFDFQAITDQ